MKKFVSRLAALLTAALALSGCGSIVYKDGATTYVAAGHAATKALTDGATTLAAARDRAKEAEIIGDATCPIGQTRLFLKPKAESERAILISALPLTAPTEDCKTLARCEANSGGALCGKTCYSREEANCIVNLEHDAALAQKRLTGEAAEKFEATVEPLARELNLVEYRRATPPQAILLQDGSKSVLEYLDLLDKLAKNQKSEVASAAKSLSQRITSTTADLTTITDKQLSATDKKSLSTFTGAIGALGKFVSDAKDIAANANDAEEIRRIVTQRSSDIDALIAALKDLATGDALLAETYTDLANATVLDSIQTRFAGARDPFERLNYLTQRNIYSFSNRAKTGKAVGDLFDAMLKSHVALTQLVLHPDDKDLQAISNARFQEFKIIAFDVLALAQTFK